MKNWTSLKRHKLLIILKSAIGVETFLAPVMTIFYLDYVGISFIEYAYFQTVLFMLVSVLEVPTGVLADTIGRKKTLIISEIIYLTAMVLLVIFPSKLTLWLSAILYPVGTTLGSGNLKAISYEVFKRKDQVSEFHKVLSIASSMQLFFGAIAALLGGFLASLYLALPLIIDSMLFLVSIVLTIILLEDDKKTRLFEEMPGQGLQKGFAVLAHGFKHLKTDPTLVFLLLISATFFAMIRGVFLTYQPLLIDSGFNLQTLGLIFALFGGVAAIHSFLSGKILGFTGSINGYVGLMIIIALLSTIVLLGSGLNKYFVLGAILCHQCIRGLHPPFFSFSINRCIPSGHASRSTILSVSNLANSLFCSVVILALGFASKSNSYQHVFIAITLALTFLSFLFLIFFRTWKQRFVGMEEKERIHYAADRS